MKISRLLALIICALFLIGIDAQDYRSEVKRLSEHNRIPIKDRPLVDSLLEVIKSAEGIYNEDYLTLAVLKINTIYVKDKSTLEPLYNDVLAAAPKVRIPDNIGLKKALNTIVNGYYNDKPKQNKALLAAWQTEMANASPSDSLDDKFIKRLQLNYSIAHEYARADSLIESYIEFVDRIYGPASSFMQKALALRDRNYTNWLSFSKGDEKRNIYHRRTDNGLRLEEVVLKIYGDKSVEYQDVLVKNGGDILTANWYDIEGPELIAAKKTAVKSLKKWAELKGDTLNISLSDNRKGLSDLFSNLVEAENDTVASRKYARMYIDLTKDKFGRESDQYFDALTITGFYFDEQESDRLLDEQIAVAEKLYGTQDYRCQSLLLTRSTRLQCKGDMGGALASFNPDEHAESMSRFFADQAVMIDSINNSLIASGATPEDAVNMSDAVRHLKIPRFDRSYASLNSQYGNYAAARKYYRRLIPDDLASTDPMDTINLFTDYIGALNEYKRYNQTDSLFGFAREMVALASQNPSRQADMIVLTADLSASPEALDFVNECFETYPVLLQSDVLKSNLWYSLAEVSARTGKYKEALALADKAAALAVGPHPVLHHLLFSEIVYLLQSDFKNALKANLEQFKYYTDSISDPEKYLEYLTLAYRRAQEALCVGDDDELRRAVDLHTRLVQDVDSKEHAFADFSFWNSASVVNALNNYVGVYPSDYTSVYAEERYRAGDVAGALGLIKPNLTERYNLLLSSVAELVAKNRIPELQNLADETRDALVRWSPRLNDPDINAMAYNVLLLTKQLTLNTAESIRRIVAHSGDENLNRKWTELTEIDDAITKNMAAGLPVDDLMTRKNSLYTQISVDANLVGDISANLHAEWVPVRDALSDKDCAVEFTTFRNPGAQDTYVAFVLTAGKAPDVIPLFEADEIATADPATPDSTFYDKIWGPIVSAVPGVKNIYFSPAGALHLLGIEYLPLHDGAIMADRFNMYRVSSTRNLTEKRAPAHRNAAIFGGINYDNMLPEEAAQPAPDLQRDMDALIECLDEETRAGVAYLPGTKSEADTISALLSPWTDVKLFIGDVGTESNVKSFSSNSPSILHLATHGFYWTEKEAGMTNGLSFLSSVRNKAVSQADRDMSRSGILLSGANNTLKGRNRNVFDDGILTAKEVSALNLANSDLIVLSACQSALGEVSGEGVFGLQRGFKQAGANSIMMSLWKVDDQATRLLMTKFYENLVAGKSKQKSLNDAVKYLREYQIEVEADAEEEMTASQRRKALRQEPDAEDLQHSGTQKNIVTPYANPRFWAAFILLDAPD